MRRGPKLTSSSLCSSFSPLVRRRAITTPYILPTDVRSIRVSLAALLTPYEREKPWILYLTPGLLASTAIYVCWTVFVMRIFRGLFLPGWGAGKSSKSSFCVLMKGEKQEDVWVRATRVLNSTPHPFHRSREHHHPQGRRGLPRQQPVGGPAVFGLPLRAVLCCAFFPLSLLFRHVVSTSSPSTRLSFPSPPPYPPLSTLLLLPS